MNDAVYILILFFVLSVNVNCIEILHEMPKSEEIRTGKDEISRTGRAGLVAFKPFGEDVHVGLDLLLPFVKIPTKRQLNNNPYNEPLLTVNTAAVTIGGLISGIGMFIGHLLRSLITLRGREDSNDNKPDVETRAHSAEHRLDFDDEGGSRRFTRMLEPFKLIYRNSSGARIDTSFAALIDIINETFLENDIDLNSCMRKSLCSLVQRASTNIEKGNATGTDKMIDGLMNLNWILQLAQKTAVEDAIIAGKSSFTDQCLLKYPTCKWKDPEEKLYELIKKYVKFI